MSNCEVCMEQFDHSVHKPHILLCPHTFCLSCINQLTNKSCPICNEPFNKTNINVALLKFIPESSYDKLKDESIKALIQLNEIKQSLKSSRQEKLTSYGNKITSIQKTISKETEKAINNLKTNERQLNDECKSVLKEIQEYLDPSKYEDNILFQIDESREKIEKDKFNEVDLTNLNKKITEINSSLNKLTDEINSYENKFEFNLNEISKEKLAIGKLETVINMNQLNFMIKFFLIFTFLGI